MALVLTLVMYVERCFTNQVILNLTNWCIPKNDRLSANSMNVINDLLKLVTYALTCVCILKNCLLFANTKAVLNDSIKYIS